MGVLGAGRPWKKMGEFIQRRAHCSSSVMGLMNVTFPGEHAWTSGDITSDAGVLDSSPPVSDMASIRAVGFYPCRGQVSQVMVFQDQACKGTQMAGTGLEWPVALVSRN